MFDDADPLLLRLREVCLALPDAAEKVSHGRPTWYTTKVFAVLGGKVNGDHADPLLDRALRLDPAAGSAARDWDEVAELVESSYRQTSGVRRVARLDRSR